MTPVQHFLERVKEACHPKNSKTLVGHFKADIETLISLVQTYERALKDFEGYDKMNEYPEHEVRHTLCCEVPDLAMRALAGGAKIVDRTEKRNL